MFYTFFFMIWLKILLFMVNMIVSKITVKIKNRSLQTWFRGWHPCGTAACSGSPIVCSLAWWARPPPLTLSYLGRSAGHGIPMILENPWEPVPLWSHFHSQSWGSQGDDSANKGLGLHARGPECESQNLYVKSQAWWCTCVISALGKQNTAGGFGLLASQSHSPSKL